MVFLFLDENICCGYSVEVPQRGASNEYPQHMFSSRNKKNIDTFWLKKHLIKSYVRTSPDKILLGVGLSKI